MDTIDKYELTSEIGKEKEHINPRSVKNNFTITAFCLLNYDFKQK